MIMGVEQDLVVNEEENSMINFSAGIEGNYDQVIPTYPGFPPLFLPLILPPIFVITW